MRVSICIPTAGRPQLLERLLGSLAEQQLSHVTPAIEIVVVDNDPGGSARVVCERMAATVPWPIRYAVEPVPGVTHARNRLIEMAAPESDFIAMIDDDEVAERAWLESLLEAQARYGAEIVTGPVKPAFDVIEPSLEWVRRGGFFDPPRYATGQSLEKGFTGNILARTSVLRSLEPAFDHRFAARGAEDSHTFMRLRNAGHRIVWSQEAVAHESVPRSRMNLRWILTRNFWGWSSQAYIERDVGRPLGALALRFAKGALLLVSGTALVPFAALFGRHRLAQALVRATRGAGTLSGLVGIQGPWPR